MGKYYWLKFNLDFFGAPEMRVLMSRPDGAMYVLLYVMMLCLAGHGAGGIGMLYVTETVAYDVDALAACMGMARETVVAGIRACADLGLLQVLDNGAIYIEAVKHMVGTSSSQREAIKKANQRQKKKIIKLNGDKISPVVGTKCLTDKEKDEDTDTNEDVDTELDRAAVPALPAASASAKVIVATLPCIDGYNHPVTMSDVEQYTKVYPDVNILSHIQRMRQWLLDNASKRKSAGDIKPFINKWLSKEQKDYEQHNLEAKLNATTKTTQSASAKKDKQGMTRDTDYDTQVLDHIINRYQDVAVDNDTQDQQKTDTPTSEENLS